VEEHVLGKVTGDYGQPGGADALLDIVVDPKWLREARTIEVDLPRHLCCAACSGAGCDVCAQSGALTVRERFELPEVLRLTLPRHEIGLDLPPDSQRSLLLRIHGRGGLPASDGGASVRGRLLLRLKFTGSVSDCVREVPDEQVTSSSTLNRADVVSTDENAPSSALSPVGASPRTVISLKSSAPPNPSGLAKDFESPETRRSVNPQSRRESPPIGTIVSAQAGHPLVPSARPRGRFNWIDIAVGLVVMLIGAIAAWFLV